MICEMIIANLGRVLVKTMLCNIFNEPLADITDEFFMKVSGDYMKARATRRYFESFMDKYSDNLGKLIESSGEVNKDERLEFMISNLEMIFKEYDFSLKNLISKAFNIDDIIKDILKEKSFDRKQYSDSEWSQLNAMLRLAVVFVVDMSEKLQDFTSKTGRETIIQMNTIKGEFNRFLNDFEKNRLDLKRKETLEMSSIEIEYKNVIRKKYSQINVFGANLNLETKRYLLEEAYVTLNAVDVEEGYSRNVHDFLEDSFLFVLGEAGTGKTTFINWLAINCAIGNSELDDTPWNNRIPFVIELRKHKGEISFNTLRSLISKCVSKEHTDKWMQDVFTSQRAMILIDGMDEIPLSKRHEVLNWVSTINDEFEVKIVITSRPSVIYELLPEYNEFYENFKIIELLPMTSDLISVFINNWHKSVSGNYKWSQKNTESYSKTIFKQIRNNRSLRDLSSYPLLCAMICGLWHNNGMILPKTRNEIYEECCKMLMENRDESRHIGHEVGDKLSQQQRFAILDDIAYWFQINNFVSQKKTQVTNRINNKIRYMSTEVMDIGAEKILKFLIERSGILRNVSGNDIDFIHKTFQEYLAARVIMKNSDYGVLIEKILDYNWHETVLLAMGFSTKSDADEIMTTLLEKGKEDNKYLYAAVACFNIPVELSPEIRDKVESKIYDIIPPRNDHESKLLSTAPESIVQFLEFSDKFSIPEIKLCINTLTLINTIESLNALSKYLLNGNDTICKYIFNVIEKLDAQDVADSQLSSAIFDYAKESGEITVTSFVANIIINSKYNIAKICPKIILLNSYCFSCLKNVAGIQTCEWRITSNDDGTYNIGVENIEIKNLIIKLEDNNVSVPKTVLKNFRNIEELTIDGSIDSLLLDELYVLSEIHGLKKVHFICTAFVFERTFSEILSYFGDKKIILEISSNEVSVYDIMDLADLQCIEEIIINDLSGRHSSYGNSIADFLFMYDENKNITSEPRGF